MSGARRRTRSVSEGARQERPELEPPCSCGSEVPRLFIFASRPPSLLHPPLISLPQSCPSPPPRAASQTILCFKELSQPDIFDLCRSTMKSVVKTCYMHLCFSYYYILRHSTCLPNKIIHTLFDILPSFTKFYFYSEMQRTHSPI